MSDAASTALDNTMIALADPTRRAIMEKLFQGPARVTDLAEPFAMSLNSVSKHIKILERAQLVQRQKVGREHILTFNPQPLNDAIAWMSDKREQGSTTLDKFAALMNVDTKKTKKWALGWLGEKKD